MYQFRNSLFERFFVLSPFFWSWTIVFNVPDTKHVLSRLITIVSLYLVVTYRRELKEHFDIRAKRVYVSVLALSFFYYLFLHLFNDGHFDFARTLVAVAIYLYLVPKRFFTINSFSFLISTASLCFILFGVYEKYILGVERIGMLVNSGPYAYVCGLLLICQLYLLIKKDAAPLTKLADLILSLGLCYIVYLSGTRTAWLGLTVCFVVFPAWYVLTARNRFKYLLLLVIPVFFYGLSSVDYINKRVNSAFYQVKNAENKSNFNSSVGARLDMWRNGLAYWQFSPMVGVDKEKEYSLIEENFSQGKMQKAAHYHLTRTDRSSYHNTFVQVLVKGGLIGLALMVVMILAPVWLVSIEIRSLTVGITLFTLVSANFESQFTIYSSCAYFYVLLSGFVIHLKQKTTLFRFPQ